MIIITILVWPLLKLTNTFKIHQILCFVVAMTFLQYVAGQWKVASQSCLAAHNQISKEITFMANCPKAKGVPDADDQNDKNKHQCFIMRRHCAKTCKGKDDTCPATSLFTLNLKVNKDTKAYESVECVCSYSTYISSCIGEYTNTWSDVEKEFNEKCAADETTTSTTTTTTVAKADCSELLVKDGAIRNLNAMNSNNRHAHGNNVTVTCMITDHYVCPASLPADCIKDKATFTCNNGAWNEFEPMQCVESLESKCRSKISGRMLFGLCIQLDRVMRDVSKRECDRPTGGRLMTRKNQTQLETIITETFIGRTLAEEEPDRTYQLFVELNENLKEGQILRFYGDTPDVSEEDFTPDNFQIYEGAIYLEGKKYVNDYPPQHRPLRIDINYERDYIHLRRYHQGSNGYEMQDTKTENYKEEIKPIPAGLKPNEKFDITIENNNKEFVIKFGDTIKHYPYVNRSLHYVNVVYFYGKGFKLDSATLDGKHLRNGEQDKVYEDCFLVGLTNKNRESDPKVGWIWEDGKEAKADETAWDSDAGEPDNKNGNEPYACLSKKSKKLIDVSSVVKRGAVCQYEDETKARKTEKRKKREVENNAETVIEPLKSTKHLNLEL